MSASAVLFRPHGLGARRQKKAPPSRKYVPSETDVSSNLPSVVRCIRLSAIIIRHSVSSRPPGTDGLKADAYFNSFFQKAHPSCETTGSLARTEIPWSVCRTPSSETDPCLDQRVAHMDSILSVNVSSLCLTSSSDPCRMMAAMNDRIVIGAGVVVGQAHIAAGVIECVVGQLVTGATESRLEAVGVRQS